jgi:hypothetical protein
MGCGKIMPEQVSLRTLSRSLTYSNYVERFDKVNFSNILSGKWHCDSVYNYGIMSGGYVFKESAVITVRESIFGFVNKY